MPGGGGPPVGIQGLSPDQMVGQAPMDAPQPPGFMDKMADHFSNPLVQGGLGAGIGMLSSGGDLRQALGAGLQGGLGGYMGAEQAMKEDEKNKALQAALGAQGGVMGMGALGDMGGLGALGGMAQPIAPPNPPTMTGGY
jgi:hypothetical protein